MNNWWWLIIPTYFIHLKRDPHIPQFSENRQEHWARMSKQVMWGSVYSCIPAIHHFVPNTFLALPNLPNWWILANVYVENQFSALFVNLCENVQKYRYIFGIRLFLAILQELTYVWIRLYTNYPSTTSWLSSCVPIFRWVHTRMSSLFYLDISLN